MPGPVSEAGFPMLDDVFETIPAPVLETLPLLDDTVMPLPPGREEVLYLMVAVSLPVGLSPDVVALPPPLVGLPEPLLMLVTDGVPTPALLLGEFGLAIIVFTDAHTVGPGAP